MLLIKTLQKNKKFFLTDILCFLILTTEILHTTDETTKYAKIQD